MSPELRSALRRALSSQLGPEVVIALRYPTDGSTAALFPEELASVARAVEKRRREMAAGREAAREALAVLGHPHCAIPKGTNGAPVWPEGIVGSITHTGRLCVAALALSSARRALGIDAEIEGELDPETWPMITTDRELAALRALPTTEAKERARQLFCAKEAAYKCQHTISGTFLEFTDLELADLGALERGRFTARFTRAVPGFAIGDPLDGDLLRIHGHFIATCALRG